MKLYKFKSDSKRNIDDLLNDRLWVSTLEFMNDPTDLGFYISSKYNEKEIASFQDALNRSIVVASFCNVIQNRRLWNYYSNGMKGIVLTYRSEELINAFGRYGDKLKGRAFAGRVSYGPDKYDLTGDFEEYLSTKRVPDVNNNFGALLH